MERVMSVEEKIKRAEEIYAKRQEGMQRKTATVTVNSDNKKDIKLLKKMIIQIILSLLIYLIIYIIQNNNYIFSEDFLKKVNEILSYDMNFSQIYENAKNIVTEKFTEMQNRGKVKNDKDSTEEEGENDNKNVEETKEKSNEENQKEEVTNGIGGAVEITQEVNGEENNMNEEQGITNNETKELSQEEQDIQNIKSTTTFIKPIEGTISSKFGQRNPTTSSVPKNHTGVDIAANTGTKIISATDGSVVLVSEEGDFGKHLKIQIGEVSVIYAHCNKIYVKQGDSVKQGQEIAEVGSTGNSTGPHLHFEIRISERIIDPEKILEL